MNTIVLVTFIAGNIVSSATFGTLKDCKEARIEVMSQPDITAYCVFKEVKPDRSREMFKLFGDMITRMGELEKQ